MHNTYRCAMRGILPLLAAAALSPSVGVGVVAAFAPSSSRPSWRSNNRAARVDSSREKSSPFLGPLEAAALPLSPLDEVLSTAADSPSSFSSLLTVTAAPSVAISDAPSPLLHSPVVWSVLAMISIVSLLLAWEEAVE